jgi:hypothetical protein
MRTAQLQLVTSRANFLDSPQYKAFVAAQEKLDQVVRDTYKAAGVEIGKYQLDPDLNLVPAPAQQPPQQQPQQKK